MKTIVIDYRGSILKENNERETREWTIGRAKSRRRSTWYAITRDIKEVNMNDIKIKIVNFLIAVMVFIGSYFFLRWACNIMTANGMNDSQSINLTLFMTLGLGITMPGLWWVLRIKH